MDYWQSFRIKISHRDTYSENRCIWRGQTNFNENDNLFLLLKMSALKYWDISSKQ